MAPVPDFNDQVFWASLCGLTFLLIKIFEYVKLVMSFKRAQPDVNLKALSYNQFKALLLDFQNQ